MSEYVIKDSGERQEFQTGSVRDTANGKGRFDLISPVMLKRLALHLEAGAKKYGDRNWEKGQPLGRYLDSALRHINAYREGLRDEDHLTAALWNLQALIHTEEQIKDGALPWELDDNNYLGSYKKDPDCIRSNEYITDYVPMPWFCFPKVVDHLGLSWETAQKMLIDAGCSPGLVMTKAGECYGWCGPSSTNKDHTKALRDLMGGGTI